MLPDRMFNGHPEIYIVHVNSADLSILTIPTPIKRCLQAMSSLWVVLCWWALRALASARSPPPAHSSSDSAARWTHTCLQELQEMLHC